MKILHINSNYLHTPLHSELIYGLEQYDIENLIVMPRKKNDTKHLSSNLWNHKALIIHKQLLDNKDRVFYFYKQRKIRKWLNNEKFNIKEFDLVHSHTLFSDGYFAYKSGIPYIVTIRNTDLNYYIKYYKHLHNTGKKILDNAKAIIFLSESYKKSTIDILFKYDNAKKFEILKKSYVIPNGINKYWIENQSKKKKEIDMAKNNLNFLFVGRIMENKNIQNTAEMLNKVLAEYNFTLNVVGPIVDQDYFDKLMVISNIKYHGVLEKQNLKELMANMDIFIMLSAKETFGLVYLEAISQQLPVLYTAYQGFDGYFSDGFVGQSVVFNNIENFSEKLTLLLNNYEKIQENLLSIDKNIFSWQHNILKHIEIYRSVMNY